MVTGLGRSPIDKLSDSYQRVSVANDGNFGIFFIPFASKNITVRRYGKNRPINGVKIIVSVSPGSLSKGNYWTNLYVEPAKITVYKTGNGAYNTIEEVAPGRRLAFKFRGVPAEYADSLLENAMGAIKQICDETTDIEVAWQNIRAAMRRFSGWMRWKPHRLKPEVMSQLRRIY